MNFWAAERFPFIPAVAAQIQYQIAPPFNNSCWEMPQIPAQLVPSPAFFQTGVSAHNPWARKVVIKDERSEGSNSVDLWQEAGNRDKRATRSPNEDSLAKRDCEDRSSKRRPISSRGTEKGDDWDRRKRSRDDSDDERYSGSRGGKRSRDDKEEESKRRRHSSKRSDEDDSNSRGRIDDDDRKEYPKKSSGSDNDGTLKKRTEGTGSTQRSKLASKSEGDPIKHSKSRMSNDDIKDTIDYLHKRSKYVDSDSKFSLEAANYKNQTPNETIMIRGLAQHITENEIRQDIVECGLMPKDIRLIRKKETGVSRGFAFVEFNNTEEALYWMELKQGVLMLQDMYRAVMQFSIAATEAALGGPGGWPAVADWVCLKCYAHNFKKRMSCYKCMSSRPEADAVTASNETSPHPTTKLMIRNLDPLTNEEELLKEVSAISSISIQSCQISRDGLTNLSRGVCYLEMKNVLEAIKLFNELTAGPLIVQNKKVSICYCKLPQDKSTAVLPQQPAAWPADQQYTLADVGQLAEYSASMYAANPQQKAAYLQYYTQYYTNQFHQMTLPEGTDTNAAAAVAQSAIQMAQTKKAALSSSDASTVWAAASQLWAATANKPPLATITGYFTTQQLIGNTSIGEPDVSSYVYEESSGYYFDQKTGLYYDASSQYYYHSQEQVFLYWDAEKKAFMLAPSDMRQEKAGESKEDKDDKKKDKEKSQDKVKVAKRIAKDMERWAKTLNQKKDFTKQSVAAVQQAQNAARAAATADIAFAVLERKDAVSADRMIMPPVSTLPAEEEPALVASYGGGSDSDEGSEDHSASLEDQYTDWVKMACMLCKRQFPAKEALQRHQQLSDLHRQNMEAWYREKGLEPPSQKNYGGAGGYRDRAKERRQKFGTPDVPKPCRLKEKFLKEQEEVTGTNYEEPTRAGIPSGNLGNRMLQKMGWSEGMGLGKLNQGRTDIVQAVHRVSAAGLGVAGSNLGPAVGGGASYKDNVKRAAMARFSELKDK